MSEFLDLRKVALDLSSPLWGISELEGEQVLQVTGNVSRTDKTGVEAYLVDEHHGKGGVALIGGVRRNSFSNPKLLAS